MALPFIIPAAASLIGSGISALSGSRTAANNLRAQQQRQASIDAGAATNASQINSQYGGISDLLKSLLATPYNSQQASTNFGFNPLTSQQVSAGGYDPSTMALPNKVAASSINTSAITGNQGYNVGQDALMQFLRADPSGKMQGTNGVLQEIAATGLPSDLSSIFASAHNVNASNNADLLASVTGTSKSVGQRFGSASQRIAGDTARRLADEQSLQNSQLALQAGDAAANRRLSAASTLGQFQLSGANSLLSSGQAQSAQILQALLANQSTDLSAQNINANLASNAGQFNANAANQASQFGIQSQLQAALANQQANNQVGQFNVNAGFQAGQLGNAAIGQNNAQTLAQRAMQLQGVQVGGQLAGQQSSLLNQLLAIRAGQPTPQQQPGTSTGNAIGSTFQDLASILQLYNRYGQQPQAPSASSVGNVFIPQVNIQ
jgi:hypothetical protein